MDIYSCEPACVLAQQARTHASRLAWLRLVEFFPRSGWESLLGLCPSPRGIGSGLRSAGHAELGEHVGHVVLDCLLGQEQLGPDLAVGFAVLDELEHLEFLGGETLQQRVTRDFTTDTSKNEVDDVRVE